MPEVLDVALAAPNEAAADAGAQLARAGGNAVDAALAACLVTMVNEVGIVSLSSGAFITVQPADGSAPVTIDGWMDMPGRGRVLGGGLWDVHTGYGGGVTVTVGPGSVAAHGAVAAIGEAHRRFGSLPWAQIVAPAVDVARRGFPMSSASRYYLGYVADTIFGWDEEGRAVLGGAEGGLTTGPILVPGLDATFAHLAEHGPASLYTGELARAICADVLDRGGILGPQDLSAYRPVVRPALVTRAAGWTLGTNPPPSVGGVCVAAMMTLLGGRPRGAWTPGDRELLIRVQRAVLGHRLDVLDHSGDLARAAEELLERVDTDALGVLESGSTAHVSAVDSAGTACAITASSGYGSGMMARGTGVWLNNCLGERELNPRGLHGLAPGSRLLSNMAPSVARSADGTVMAIGSPGADRITTAIVQVLAGVVTGGLDLQEAIDQRRVHVHRAGRADETVKIEQELSMYYGGVAAALRRPDGRLVAAADPRRDGATRIVRGTGS